MKVDISNVYDDFINDVDGVWSIVFQDLNDVQYDLDIDNKIIQIHNFGLSHDKLMASPYFQPQVMLAQIEALRMARHIEWLDGSLSRYHPKTILLIGRICVADAQAQKINCAWNAKMEGDNSLWKHILCSDLSDIALAHERGLETYLASGMTESKAIKKSMSIAFNNWFACEDRLRNCDHDTLNLMDDMIASHTVFKNENLEKSIIPCLTLMAGDKASYIDNVFIKDILKNPYYSSMHDEVNQIHLSHVMHDMNKIRVGGLVFQDAGLAARFSFLE